jgi:hypothetical protein
MSVKRGKPMPPLPAVPSVPRPPEDDVPQRDEIAERKGTGRNQSILYHHKGLDVWSVYIVIEGVFTWVALPNERIARGAYAGGPPYEVPDGNPPQGGG